MRSRSHLERGKLIRSLSSLLACVLVWQGSFVSIAAERSAKKVAAMSADQRIAHVLSRLTFGARPGDFEKVKAMGVDAERATDCEQSFDGGDAERNAVGREERRRGQDAGRARPASITEAHAAA